MCNGPIGVALERHLLAYVTTCHILTSGRHQKNIHLDRTYSLLTSNNVQVMLEIFKLLDIHGDMTLNDVQFLAFMSHMTDLHSVKDIYRAFDVFDVDGSGSVDFDEFYLLCCILIGIKDGQEKQFIYRHSRTVFDLMDEDGSNAISGEEFETYGFLFNFHGTAVRKIFNEFDVSGDQELDYKEFKMFAMACIDKQVELEREDELREARKEEKAMLKDKQRVMKEMKTTGLLTKEEYSEAMEESQADVPILEPRKFNHYCSIL
ncbi:EF-hand calcium-binding domain-containing protein 9-like [Lineus longissimus]|uniref:EF-hand calcium-binding domain-containing protein 9-like n=1 Tax=Lineus longissimus TaxID=88925 RepID=UPI002B4E9E3D